MSAPTSVTRRGCSGPSIEGPLRVPAWRTLAPVDLMPEPGDLIAAFSPQPGRCFRMVRSRQLQATHCYEPPGVNGSVAGRQGAHLVRGGVSACGSGTSAAPAAGRRIRICENETGCVLALAAVTGPSGPRNPSSAPLGTIAAACARHGLAAVDRRVVVGSGASPRPSSEGCERESARRSTLSYHRTMSFCVSACSFDRSHPQPEAVSWWHSVLGGSSTRLRRHQDDGPGRCRSY